MEDCEKLRFHRLGSSLRQPIFCISYFFFFLFCESFWRVGERHIDGRSVTLVHPYIHLSMLLVGAMDAGRLLILSKSILGLKFRCRSIEEDEK